MTTQDQPDARTNPLRPGHEGQESAEEQDRSSSGEPDSSEAEQQRALEREQLGGPSDYDESGGTGLEP